MDFYFAHVDTDGNVLGFYHPSIHGNNIPENVVKISEKEWQFLLSNPQFKIDMTTGQFVEKENNNNSVTIPETKLTFWDWFVSKIRR